MPFQYQSNIPALTQDIRRKAERHVEKTCHAISTHIKEGMAEAKHGRRYRNHVASAPGESPAIDTSNLANSIQVEVTGLQGVVGTNMEYAEVLEFGGVHMEPRPYFGPAFEDGKKDFEQGLKDLAK